MLTAGQIKAGSFPVRWTPEDRQSGPVNWLLDGIAPDRKTAGGMVANFAQVVKDGELRFHPRDSAGWWRRRCWRRGVARAGRSRGAS